MLTQLLISKHRSPASGDRAVIQVKKKVGAKQHGTGGLKDKKGGEPAGSGRRSSVERRKMPLTAADATIKGMKSW